MSDLPTINGDPVHITWYVDDDRTRVKAVVNSLDTGHIYKSSDWLEFSEDETAYREAAQAVGDVMYAWLETHKD